LQLYNGPREEYVFKLGVPLGFLMVSPWLAITVNGNLLTQAGLLRACTLLDEKFVSFHCLSLYFYVMFVGNGYFYKYSLG
jgi:hypothetical protein